MNNTQSGNVLIIILVTVALLAALTMTMSRTTEQSGNISNQQAQLAAQDIASYANSVEGAVNRLSQKSISERDMDFRKGATNPNANCPDEKCQIFNPQGGGIVWQEPPAAGNDGSDWIITGGVRVKNLGTDTNVATAAELLLILPNVNLPTCLQLNKNLGVTNPSDVPPKNTSSVNYTTRYVGTFGTGNVIQHASLNGRQSGCFEGNGTPAAGTYHFYHVLLAR